MGPRRFPQWSALATSLFLLLAPGLAAQQGTTVRCDALVGFNGIVHDGRFAPVILSIENPGARMSAEVTLGVSRGGFRGTPFTRTIRQETILDPGATRRLPFLVPIPRGAGTLRATVSSRGVDVASLQLELGPLSTAGRIIVGISSELSLDGLTSLDAPTAMPGGPGTTRVVYPRLDDLPRGWAGYDGVDAVIVHDTSFQELRADQVTALEGWVVTGGVLVFTGGAAALQHAPAGFGRLLPVEVAGLTRRAELDLRTLPLSAARRLAGIVEVADARVTKGRVLAGDQDLPLVVRRTLGKGAVWFLAFDPTVPPVSSWDGALGMWRSILAGDRTPAMGAAPRETLSDPWIAALLAASPVSFPSVSAALAFIAFSVALLIPPVYARMGARARLLLIVAVSAAASAAGWVVFNRALFHPGITVLDAARVEARSGDGRALVTEKVGFFSSSACTVEVRLAAGDAVVEAAGARTAQRDPIVDPSLLLSGPPGRTLITGLDVQRLGARLLVLQDVLALDVRVQLHRDGSRLTALVINEDGRTLKDCVIMRAGRAFAIGEVSPRTTVRREFDLAEGTPLPGRGTVFPGSDPLQAGLWKALGEDVDVAADSAAAPWAGSPRADPPARLIGWLDGPVLRVSVPGGRTLGDRPGLALLSVEAE